MTKYYLGSIECECMIGDLVSEVCLIYDCQVSTSSYVAVHYVYKHCTLYITTVSNRSWKLAISESTSCA